MENRSFFQKNKLWISLLLVVVIPGLLLAAGTVQAEKKPFHHYMSLEVMSENAPFTVKTYYEAPENTVYFFLPAFADLNRARMILPKKFTLLLDDVSVENNAVLSDIQPEHTYHAVISEKMQSSEYTLIFMKSAVLPAMFIQTESGSLNRVHNDKEYKEKGFASIVTASGQLHYSSDLSYIKGRGNFTWTLKKKPYNIEFPVPADLLGMGADTGWCLLADATDDTHLRNKIVCDVASAMKLSFTPSSEFIDLFINNEYMGLYQLTENIKIGNDRVDIEDLEAETQVVNPLLLSKYPHVTEDNRPDIRIGSKIMNNPSDISGGYLLELDYSYRTRASDSGFFTKMLQSITIDAPKHASLEQVSYIQNFINKAETALIQANDADEESQETFFRYFDLDSWAKKFLLEECFLNYDVGLTSSYFYKHKGSDVLYAGPVWDYDLAIGNYRGQVTVPEALYIEWPNKYRTWFHILYEKEFFRKQAVSYYPQYIMPLLEDVIANKIDSYAKTIERAEKLNRIRWKDGGNAITLQFDTFSEPVENLKSFLRRRVDFLNDMWVYNEPHVTLRLAILNAPPSDCSFLYNIKPGGKLPEIPKIDKRFTMEEWAYKDTGEAFDINTPITEDVELTAKMVRIGSVVPSTRAAQIQQYANTATRYLPGLCIPLFVGLFLCVELIKRKRTPRNSKPHAKGGPPC